ncbi:MAG: 4Fe-4S binding protein [Planctomycetota bacterium]
MPAKPRPLLTQLRFYTGAAALAVLNLRVFGIDLRKCCTPGFNCHGCPWATLACPVGAITYGMSIRAVPLLAVATVVAVGVALGRLVCGFFCPFGWFQDLLYRLPARKTTLPNWTRAGKYLGLVLLVLALPYALGYEEATARRAYYCTICPNGTLTAGLPRYLGRDRALAAEGDSAPDAPDAPVTNADDTANRPEHEDAAGTDDAGADADFADFGFAAGEDDAVCPVPEGLLAPTDGTDSGAGIERPAAGSVVSDTTADAPAQPAIGAALENNWIALSVLGVFLVLMTTVSRPFCRILCPLGAMYAVFARLAFVRIEVQEEACTQCGLCDRVCPVDLDVRREAGGRECIACGACIGACSRGAIRRVVGW